MEPLKVTVDAPAVNVPVLVQLPAMVKALPSAVTVPALVKFTVAILPEDAESGL